MGVAYTHRSSRQAAEKVLSMEQNKKCAPAQLAPEIYRTLENIVGPDNISSDRAVLECYSKFSIDSAGTLKKHAKDPSNIPACVVLPATTAEIQEIVRTANRFRIPFIAMTNGQPDRVPWVENDIEEALQIEIMGGRTDYTPGELCRALGMDGFGYHFPSGGAGRADRARVPVGGRTVEG